MLEVAPADLSQPSARQRHPTGSGHEGPLTAFKPREGVGVPPQAQGPWAQAVAALSLLGKGHSGPGVGSQTGRYTEGKGKPKRGGPLHAGRRQVSQGNSLRRLVLGASAPCAGTLNVFYRPQPVQLRTPSRRPQHHSALKAASWKRLPLWEWRAGERGGASSPQARLEPGLQDLLQQKAGARTRAALGVCP